MAAGDKFPEVTVFYNGLDYYLADGFHRYFAHKKLGKASIGCNVVTGTLRDAILFSKGANADNGLHRSNATKRKCVNDMLDDFEWQFWNNAEIAKACRVSEGLVAAVRGGEKPEVVKVKRNGKTFERKAKYEMQNEEPKHDTASDVIKTLADENDKLKDRLAVAVYAADESEKKLAENTIAQLREDVRLLEIELKSTRISRDTLLNENAAMKKQIAAMQRQLKK
jgi:hypothetical protein